MQTLKKSCCMRCTSLCQSSRRLSNSSLRLRDISATEPTPATDDDDGGGGGALDWCDDVISPWRHAASDHYWTLWNLTAAVLGAWYAASACRAVLSAKLLYVRAVRHVNERHCVIVSYTYR